MFYLFRQIFCKHVYKRVGSIVDSYGKREQLHCNKCGYRKTIDVKAQEKNDLTL